jgi:hypothetical protein
LSTSSNVEGINQKILRGPADSYYFSHGFHCVFIHGPPAQFETSELVKKEEDNRRKKTEFLFFFVVTKRVSSEKIHKEKEFRMSNYPNSKLN